MQFLSSQREDDATVPRLCYALGQPSAVAEHASARLPSDECAGSAPNESDTQQERGPSTAGHSFRAVFHAAVQQRTASATESSADMGGTSSLPHSHDGGGVEDASAASEKALPEAATPELERRGGVLTSGEGVLPASVAPSFAATTPSTVQPSPHVGFGAHQAQAADAELPSLQPASLAEPLRTPQLGSGQQTTPALRNLSDGEKDMVIADTPPSSSPDRAVSPCAALARHADASHLAGGGEASVPQSAAGEAQRGEAAAATATALCAVSASSHLPQMSAAHVPACGNTAAAPGANVTAATRAVGPLSGSQHTLPAASVTVHDGAHIRLGQPSGAPGSSLSEVASAGSSHRPGVPTQARLRPQSQAPSAMSVGAARPLQSQAATAAVPNNMVAAGATAAPQVAANNSIMRPHGGHPIQAQHLQGGTHALRPQMPPSFAAAAAGPPQPCVWPLPPVPAGARSAPAYPTQTGSVHVEGFPQRSSQRGFSAPAVHQHRAAESLVALGGGAAACVPPQRLRPGEADTVATAFSWGTVPPARQLSTLRDEQLHTVLEVRALPVRVHRRWC